MAAPKETLEGKVEFALLAQLSDAGLEEYALLLGGHEYEEHETPSINVVCFGGPEIPFNSGNYLQRVRISIRSPMDLEPEEQTIIDPREAHREIVQLVREAVIKDGIEAELSAHEPNFTASMVIEGQGDAGTDGRQFYTNIELEIDCAASDFE